MIFIVVSFLETVHDTVQYWYCIFSLLYRLLRIRLNVRIPYFHTHDWERQYAADVQYSVQYTLLLLYNVDNVLLWVIYQLNGTYLCMLHEYHVISRYI